MNGPGILASALSFFAVIAPLIFVHELGHYLVGRWFGVKAETFSIGFGREIVGWTDKRGTRWKIGWLPMGGYVKFAGDMSPASEPSDEWLSLPPAERAQTFQARTLWQKALIVAAGPAVNFLVAILIFAAFIAAFGDPRTPTRLSAVMPGSAAASAGFRPGDVVQAIGGRRVKRFEDIRSFVEIRPGARVDVLARRGSETLLLPVVIGTRTEIDRLGRRHDLGQLGVSPGSSVRVHLPVAQVPFAALRLTGTTLTTMAEGLGQIVTGTRPVEELGGPLKIAQYSGEQASTGWLNFVAFVALISLNLGFINLLPIPMLDGGHLAFYALSAIRGKPISARVLDWSFRGGLALLLGLMMVVTFNDLASFGLL